MLVDRKPGPRPAQHPGKGQQAEAVIEAQMPELEPGRVELPELGEGAVEQHHSRPDDEPCRRAAGYPLENAVIEERPAYEWVGRADQFRYLDLLASGENLQADGIEGHRHQGESEQPGEQRYREPREPESRLQAL